jgi:hypothetical protein
MANYPTLTVPADKQQYMQLDKQKAQLGRYVVEVMVKSSENRSGSWAKGFKFSKRKTGVLVRIQRKPYRYLYSANHGETWHVTLGEALKSKNKILLDNGTRKEFAFDLIQAENRKYYGLDYKWTP